MYLWKDTEPEDGGTGGGGNVSQLKKLRPRKGVCLGHTVRDSMVGTKISPLGSQFSGLAMVPWGFFLCVFITFTVCLSETEPLGFYTSRDIRSFPHFPAISWGT